MVKIYAQGDTSYTRASQMLRNAHDLEKVAGSKEFLNEFNLCDPDTQMTLRQNYKYYKARK